MRNYVIINGVNSLTIQGLAINNLPPITKPMIRTQREEIDGRDGDIVTELGYSAYDKQIEIGLWGTYDINDIIKYFTGEGTIVFSNEDDKYYNFKILDQIDYQKLLKFKTATITFHCQPFKYPLEEEPVEAEITTLTGSGTTLTLNNTEEAPMSVVYKGNTSQNTTTGKNLFSGNYSQFTNTGGTGNLYSYFSLPNDNDYYTLTITAKEGFTASRNYYLGFTGNGGDANGGVTWAVSTSSKTYTKGETKSITTNNWRYVSIYPANQAELEALVEKFDIQLEKGSTATAYEPYTNGASPNPDYPQDISVVSGDNEIKVEGKNYLDLDTVLTSAGTTFTKNNNIYSITNLSVNKVNINLKPNTTYTLSCKQYDQASSNVRFQMFKGNSYLGAVYSNGTSQKSYTFTTDSTGVYSVNTTCSTPVTYPLYFKEVQIEEGSQPTDYQEYKGATYPISLGSQELCKIGDYQDRIYKDSGKWYVKKEIGKVVLDGSENWAFGADNGTTTYIINSNISNLKKNTNIVSNYFKESGNSYIQTTTTDNRIILGMENSIVGITSGDTNPAKRTKIQTWLSNNNTTLNYVLATPTYTLIEDSTLINQLETIKKSYEGQTNISQENNDLPFELDVSVTFLTPMEINNIGNIYAKPILTIEGTGNIGVVLNDIQILDIDLTNNGKIAIDVTKLEAYNPDDDTLLNRLVTGDYMKLLINEGENTITFTGNVSGATLTNYIRWI